MKWQQTDDDLLKKLWSEKGYTAEKIGHIMGRTRSAVLGRVHRLNLETRTTANRKHQVPRKRHVYRPEVEQGLALPGTVTKLKSPVYHDVEQIELDELLCSGVKRKVLCDLGDDDCRWPIGDPRHPGFGFCSRERVPGKPYCEDHLARAYESPVIVSREMVLEPQSQAQPVSGTQVEPPSMELEQA